MAKQTIIIIEDEKDLRDAVATVLKAEEFSVHTAKNGADGVKKVLTEKPDLVLLDINLPDMTGHDVLKEIRNEDWGKTARVIFLTSHNDPENIIHAFEGEAVDFLVKPNVSLEDIVAKVKETLAA